MLKIEERLIQGKILYFFIALRIKLTRFDFRMGFAECKFLNMDSEFEMATRRAIHVQGAPFVQNVDKFKKVLKKIWCEEVMDKPKIEDDEGIVVDKVLSAASGNDGKSVLSGNAVEKGHHTEKLLQWIEENPNSWDTGLEEYLFRLRMGSIDDGDGECNSPFAVMYGRSAMPQSAPPITSDPPPPVKQRGWPRGRSRSRGRGRGRGRRIAYGSTVGQKDTEKTSNITATDTRPAIGDTGSDEIEAETKSVECPVDAVIDKGGGGDATSDMTVCRRMKGRPRKSQNPMRYLENNNKTEEVTVTKQSETECPLSNKKYGLRTNLKAKVKTS